MARNRGSDDRSESGDGKLCPVLPLAPLCPRMSLVPVLAIPCLVAGNRPRWRDSLTDRHWPICVLDESQRKEYAR